MMTDNRVPVKSYTAYMYKNKFFYTIAAKKNIKFLHEKCYISLVLRNFGTLSDLS